MLSSDALFDGKLVICQEQRGYRFSIDAVLLAGLTGVKPGDTVADLGTGCGVIPLILGFRRAGAIRIIGIEIQEELADLARKNVEANDFTELIAIQRGDFREIRGLFSPESFSLVVSNPPYRRLHSGRINTLRQCAVARHEITASLEDVFRTAGYLLRNGGRLAVIYPAVRAGHLLEMPRQYGFSPRHLDVIYSNSRDTARLVRLECRKGGGEELRIAPPFFIYEDGGGYTEAMKALYRA